MESKVDHLLAFTYTRRASRALSSGLNYRQMHFASANRLQSPMLIQSTKITIMKRIAPILFLFFSATVGAAIDQSSVDNIEACKAERSTQCSIIYEKAQSQCLRYFIPRTEARPICLENTELKKDLCLEKAEAVCSTTNSPKAKE